MSSSASGDRASMDSAVKDQACIVDPQPGGQALVQKQNRLGAQATGVWTEWRGERLIPKRVVIETVFGCNARCHMCPITLPETRKPEIMPMDKYRALIDALTPYREHIKMLDLFGLGEPLIDPLIFERIRHTRDKGFRGLSISTNMHLMDVAKRRAILDTGIETVIISIDGIKKETHEAIRPRVNYDRVLDNTLGLIRLRNEGGYKTRFVIRFIQQPRNHEEWEPYREFWKTHISKEKNDLILCYQIHDWSGKVDENLGASSDRPAMDTLLENVPCHHIFEKLVIQADGSVSLCFEDLYDSPFEFGNVHKMDPIELFNSPRFNKIRKLHQDGKRKNLKICEGCSVLTNELLRIEG